MNLVNILQHKIQQSSDENDIDIRIARYILENFDNQKFTVQQMAADNFTSNATISRFFKEIGYDSFHDFQIAHKNFSIDRQEVLADFQADSPRSLSMENTFIQTNFDVILDDLQQFENEIKISEIDFLCNLIYSKKAIYLYATGIPGSIAEILQYNFLAVGKFTEYFPVINDQIENASKLEKDDLAIFLSLEGSHVMTKKLTFAVTTSPATSILITQNPSMKFSENFNHVIALGSHSKAQSGKYKLLFFIESLIHRYLVKFAN